MGRTKSNTQKRHHWIKTSQVRSCNYNRQENLETLFIGVINYSFFETVVSSNTSLYFCIILCCNLVVDLCSSGLDVDEIHAADTTLIFLLFIQREVMNKGTLNNGMRSKTQTWNIPQSSVTSDLCDKREICIWNCVEVWPYIANHVVLGILHRKNSMINLDIICHDFLKIVFSES
jgi:hypothetical protein